jgi:3-oxoacyl-[acyl-carrier-protein] synthase-3
MFGRYEGIKISGIESVVPKMIFDNYDYIEGIEDRKTKKQVKLTGIRQRHVLEEKQTISQLATVAANNIINNLLWDRNDIRVLVFVTQTP